MEGKKEKQMKKIVSVFLIVAMVISMIPVGIKKSETRVDAAVSGITSGATYKIVSAYNGKAITQTDVSDYWADCVVWNTDAMSDLARWRVEESGDYYTITNIVTNKSIKTTGNSNGDKLDLNGNDNADRYKWKIVPITSGEYAGCFFIVSAVKNDNGEEEYAEIISDEDKRDKDGAQVRLWTKVTSIDYEPRQVWRFEKSDAEYTKFTEEMNDTIVNAFKDQYYKLNSDTGYMAPISDDGFWGMAEIMESFLDGYETTGKAIYKDMFVTTYDDFIAVNTEDWAWKDWNDDIAWGVLASVRAYLMFGNERYLTLGKNNFDMMFERANNRSDGMLIWKMNHENDDTTSCINGPATVAACYLAIATGDESYYTKAKNLYDAWRNSTMYEREGDEIGHVWDTMHEYWCSTYNQGTFIGAATMLYQHYGDESYYEDACNAVNHTMKALCYNNILIKEDTDQTDNSKMRGILVRYLRKFIVDFDRSEYLDFFRDNIKIAWMNRNSKNIQHCIWNKKTSEDITWHSYTAYNVLSLMANLPTYADELERDAYSVIEAEDMDYTRGLISEDSDSASGGRSLGGIKDGYYTAYYNIDFGSTGASKLKLRYSRKTESDGSSGYVEFRLGSTDGTLLAKAQLDNTGDWSDWKEITVDTARITGVQNVYAVFKSDTEHVCNFDWFRFEKADNNNQGYMFLQSDSTTKYAQLKNGADDTTILARSTSRGDWEQLRVEINGDGTVSLKSLVTGKYVRAAYGSNGYYITANADTVNHESKFIIEKFSEDSGESMQVALKSIHTGKYLMADPDDSEMYILANSASVSGAWESFHFETASGEWIIPEGAVLIGNEYVTSSDIRIEGHQISTAIGGSRVVASVEPEINGKAVKEWGIIYGLKSIEGVDYGVQNEDLRTDSDNPYVKAYKSTALGTASGKLGDSATATYFVRTTRFGAFTSKEFTAKYKVRAYAVLADGSCVYSENVSDYSVFGISEYLYNNSMMNTEEAHQYLYNRILKTVDEDYEQVGFEWENTVVKPNGL